MGIEFFIIPFIFIFTLFILASFPFFSMMNNFFYKISLTDLIKFTLSFNFIFLILWFFSLFIGDGLFVGFYRFLNYYLGILLYGFLIGIFFWIIYFGFKFFQMESILSIKSFGIIIVLLFIFVNILAIYNFEKGIKVEEFEIKSNKLSKNYKFVQIGDIQYGSVSKQYMENVMNLTMKQNPDFIVMVGDLVDFDYYKKEDFDFFKDIKIPIYFITGNHEDYHNPTKILSYLNEINSFEILRNEKVNFEEIEIVGIDYNSNKFQLKNKLEEIDINKNNFSILLYHEPKGVEIGVEKGFDLMLFGHTHGGQLFPITSVVNYLYNYGSGFYRVGSTDIYTTTGAGLWGPKMRLGSQNEIVVFDLKKK